MSIPKNFPDKPYDYNESYNSSRFEPARVALVDDDGRISSIHDKDKEQRPLERMRVVTDEEGNTTLKSLYKD